VTQYGFAESRTDPLRLTVLNDVRALLPPARQSHERIARRTSTASRTNTNCSLLRQRPIPRGSRTSSPEAPARTRESPQSQGRKALLTPGIPAYPRSARKRHDRPVTPEVAGSSPVAPVKLPANGSIVLSGKAQRSTRLHKTRVRAGPNRPKTGRKRVRAPRRQAVCGRVEADREGGVRLHKMAGGQGSTWHVEVRSQQPRRPPPAGGAPPRRPRRAWGALSRRQIAGRC
jgi:hypothetical protein